MAIAMKQSNTPIKSTTVRNANTVVAGKMSLMFQIARDASAQKETTTAQPKKSTDKKK